MNAPADRKKPIQREWALQRGVKRFVARAVVQPYKFQGFDRGLARSEYEHVKEKERGIEGGWPDTGLLTPPVDFWCELKWPGNKPDDRQILVGQQIEAAGGKWAWADTVRGYCAAARAAGVPLLPNADYVAAHEDQLVASDIAKQEARKAKVPRARKPRAAKQPAARLRKIEGTRSKVLF